MYCININDFDDWRNQARELLKRRVVPDNITWQTERQDSLLFSSDENFLSLNIRCEALTIPRDFFRLAKNVACYRDENRWSVLYSVAWRLLFEDRRLLDFKIDEQVSRLLAIQKAVARDKHKMKAFVRFRKVMEPLDQLTNIEKERPGKKKDYFISWFEPEHLIVPAISPFFVKRFANMCWSIITPDICVHWNLDQLTYSEGVVRPPKEQDNLEELWRTYYANIFNPARLKLKAMQAEMPKKYWANLPEAPLIKELTRNSSARMGKMVDKDATSHWKKTKKSRYVKSKQEILRSR